MVISNKKQTNSETIFDWIPPDTTKELATDYMNALPVEKLPISGSTGAILRKQLLQKQLPLHDIDHKACDELSEVEKKELENYVENLKKYVGQGKVMKVRYTFFFYNFFLRIRKISTIFVYPFFIYLFFFLFVFYTYKRC